jgi:hypothetical protein
MVTQSVLCEVGTEIFWYNTDKFQSLPVFFYAAPAEQGCKSDARFSKVPTDLRFTCGSENYVKVKVELSLSTKWGSVGEWRYNPTHSLTSAADRGEGSSSRPGRFTPRREPRYPLNRRLGGPQSRSGNLGEEKNLFPVLGIEPRFLIVHFVAKWTKFTIPNAPRFCTCMILSKIYVKWKHKWHVIAIKKILATTESLAQCMRFTLGATVRLWAVQVTNLVL